MTNSEPVEVVAVAVTKLDASGELYLDWLLEGGIGELDQPGVLLLVADRKITDSNNGHGEVYVAPQAQYAGELSLAAQDVLAERSRQIHAEGWTPAHDDHHVSGELADAAACYALWGGGCVPHHWMSFWPFVNNPKVAPARCLLIKAGALILAEVERLDREAARCQGESGHGIS